jgi:hypothetical protein
VLQFTGNDHGASLRVVKGSEFLSLLILEHAGAVVTWKKQRKGSPVPWLVHRSKNEIRALGFPPFRQRTQEIGGQNDKNRHGLGLSSL